MIKNVFQLFVMRCLGHPGRRIMEGFIVFFSAVSAELIVLRKVSATGFPDLHFLSYARRGLTGNVTPRFAV